MKIKTFMQFAIASVFMWNFTNTIAAEENLEQKGAGKQIYGWELMSPKERTEHRKKMRSFGSEEERHAYRMEHHKRMQARAKEKGLTLPDAPQPRGAGKGLGDASRGAGGSGAGR